MGSSGCLRDIIISLAAASDELQFEMLKLAFRNQLAQTNGVLFRRPRRIPENQYLKVNLQYDFRVRTLIKSLEEKKSIGRDPPPPPR